MIVFTILMLLNRENMRERLIGLIGAGRINLTTQALDEVGDRVGRYLYMQLVVNALFGIPFGIALYFIGIPNAMLWGLLGDAAALHPVCRRLDRRSPCRPRSPSPSRTTGRMVGWTLGVFLALELVLVNVVEPLLYGRSAGLSPMAIIVAALFWTWLWGPIGLLLATPLTVCVAVMGRYIPEMGFLNMLLGVEPVLSPPARFYQRLIALDQDEAAELAEKFIKEKDRAAFYDEVAHPGARPDRARPPRAARSSPRASARSSTTCARSSTRLPEEADAAPPPLPVCIVAAHDEADHIAAHGARRRIRRLPDAVPAARQRSDAGNREERLQGRLHLRRPAPCRDPGELSRQAPAPQLPRASRSSSRCGPTSRTSSARSERLKDAGVDAVVTNLPEALQHLRDLAPPPPPRPSPSSPPDRRITPALSHAAELPPSRAGNVRAAFSSTSR